MGAHRRHNVIIVKSVLYRGLARYRRTDSIRSIPHSTTVFGVNCEIKRQQSAARPRHGSRAIGRHVAPGPFILRARFKPLVTADGRSWQIPKSILRSRGSRPSSIQETTAPLDYPNKPSSLFRGDDDDSKKGCVRRRVSGSETR